MRRILDLDFEAPSESRGGQGRRGAAGLAGRPTGGSSGAPQKQISITSPPITYVKAGKAQGARELFPRALEVKELLDACRICIAALQRNLPPSEAKQ